MNHYNVTDDVRKLLSKLAPIQELLSFIDSLGDLVQAEQNLKKKIEHLKKENLYYEDVIKENLVKLQDVKAQIVASKEAANAIVAGARAEEMERVKAAQAKVHAIADQESTAQKRLDALVSEYDKQLAAMGEKLKDKNAELLEIETKIKQLKKTLSDFVRE